MNEFLTNLLSPSWWIGVVAVSFVINLASAYFKTPLDRALARFSTRRRNKQDRKLLDLVATLEAARCKKDGLVLLAVRELKFIFIGLSLLLLCVLTLLFLKSLAGTWDIAIPFLLLVVLLLFLAMFFLQEATKLASVIKLSETKQSKDEA
jgi:hypothetical protein